MKSLQQISWTISQIERRYNIDDVDDKNAQEIISVYDGYIPQIQRILDELLDEKNGKKTDD